MNTNKTHIQNDAGTNTPEMKFRAGAVSATVWQNVLQNEKGTAAYNSVSLERVYKDKEGNWQTTHSFRMNDLPKLALVAQKAYEFVVCKQNDSQTGTA
ncbi:MAG: hypothetical protein ACMXYE_03630 [Candidatus Woesearchaeota archaeon]